MNLPRNHMLIPWFVIFIATACINPAQAEPGRWEQDISGENWNLWLDTNAEWENDRIFMPPVDMMTVPVNEPTCGWDALPLLAHKRYGSRHCRRISLGRQRQSERYRR